MICFRVFRFVLYVYGVGGWEKGVIDCFFWDCFFCSGIKGLVLEFRGEVRSFEIFFIGY